MEDVSWFALGLGFLFIGTEAGTLIYLDNAPIGYLLSFSLLSCAFYMRKRLRNVRQSRTDQ